MVDGVFSLQPSFKSISSLPTCSSMAQHPQPGPPHSVHTGGSRLEPACESWTLKFYRVSPVNMRLARSRPSISALPMLNSLCASFFHSPAPMAISWVLAIGSLLDAVKRPVLIGHNTSHAPIAATTTATCSTVGLLHWLAAWLHLAGPLRLPIGFPVPGLGSSDADWSPESEAGLGGG